MRLHQLFVLAACASVLAQPAVAANHTRAAAAPPGSVSSPPKLCRMFDSPYWDNQGFVMTCDKQAQNAAPTIRRCPMFNSSAYDTVGFTVECEKATAIVSAPPRTCPMFTPSTWDNMGFRVPC